MIKTGGIAYKKEEEEECFQVPHLIIEITLHFRTFECISTRQFRVLNIRHWTETLLMCTSSLNGSVKDKLFKTRE
jgi:hypothetical protein